MNINESKLLWLPSKPSATLENNVPKFLYRVDWRMPEEIFQYGFNLSEKSDFNFFQYFFNIYNCKNEDSLKFLNVYESPQEALFNFRKDLKQTSDSPQTLYLYVIRCDQNFYNKNITRLSISSSICENDLCFYSEQEIDKLLFSFNNIGQIFTNPFEWFTTTSIKNDQIFCALQIKFNFKSLTDSTKLNEKLIVPTFINLDFRNPNYIDLNTYANQRPFVFPEQNANQKIVFEDNVFWCPNLNSNDIVKNKDEFYKSFRAENNLDNSILNDVLNQFLDKKPYTNKLFLLDEKNKKRQVISHYYKLDLNKTYGFFKNKNQRTFHYLVKPKKIKMIFTYEKNSNKSVYLNTNITRKKSNVFYVLKDKKAKNINAINFDKYGRIIFNLNLSDQVPYAITISNYNKSKDLAEIESYPAVLNDINQTFHLEHAYSTIFYLKSNNKDYQHLELAINHKNNSFVFVNPKKKYNFSYDLVNINIAKYNKKDQGFIYGYENYCPELIDLKISWLWNKIFYKPNLFVSTNNNKNLNVEQARSTISKNNDYHFLYSINTLKVIYVDYKSSYINNSIVYSMFNNCFENNKYRWLEWKEDNISKFGIKQTKWILKKAKYDNDNLYWIINYANMDYLWVQQRGDNWGFCFLASKKSSPSKSSCLFFIEKNSIK